MSCEKILILGHSNIGDVCSDLCVVGPLLDAFPFAKISFLTSPRLASLVKGCRGISEVVVFDRYSKHKGSRKQFSLAMSLRRQRFDLVLVLKASMMFVFLGAKKVWRVDPGKIGGDSHMIDIYLSLLRRNGVRAEHSPVDFAFSEEEELFADRFLKEKGLTGDLKLVGLSPLANWSLKCWPVEKWNELIAALRKSYGITPLMFGKSGADPFSERILKEVSAQAVSAVDCCTLRQSAALINRCSAFISSDSGLAYIADSLGIPCVTLSGPTNTKCYYPYRSKGLVVRSTQPGLSCMPCLRPVPHCKMDIQGVPECMQSIGLEDVLDKVKSLSL